MPDPILTSHSVVSTYHIPGHLLKHQHFREKAFRGARGSCEKPSAASCHLCQRALQTDSFFNCEPLVRVFRRKRERTGALFHENPGTSTRGLV